MQQDETVQVLAKLGLTSLQARVYLTLVHSGKSTSKAISAAAKIDRADVYRVVAALQKQSLVEKVIATPLEFIAIPIRDGINILLDRKHKENVEIHREALALVQKFKYPETQPARLEDNDQIIVIPANEPAARKLNALGLAAQKLVYGVNDWDGAMKGNNAADLDFRKKKIVFKCLITGPKGKETVSKGTKNLAKRGILELRWYPKPTPLKLIMKDNEEMVLATQSYLSTIANPYLWTKNRVLVAIIRDYFELMWQNSKELRIQ